MLRILNTLFLILLTPVLIGFLFANRRDVTISFDPLSLEEPAFALTTPLWAGLSGTLLLGFILGGVGMWISNTRLRQRTGDAKRRIRQLERELMVAKSEARESSGGGTNLPAVRT